MKYLENVYLEEVRPVLTLLGVCVLVLCFPVYLIGSACGDYLLGMVMAMSLALGASLWLTMRVAIPETVKLILAIARRVWADPFGRDVIEGVASGLVVTALLPVVLALAPFALAGYGSWRLYRTISDDPVWRDLIVSVGRLAFEVPMLLAILYLVVVTAVLASLAVPFLALGGIRPDEVYAKVGGFLDLIERK